MPTTRSKSAVQMDQSALLGDVIPTELGKILKDLVVSAPVRRTTKAGGGNERPEAVHRAKSARLLSRERSNVLVILSAAGRRSAVTVFAPPAVTPGSRVYF